MGQVLSFNSTDEELADAWWAYDRARLTVEALYSDPASKPRQRFEACMEAIRLYKKFSRVATRHEACR